MENIIDLSKLNFLTRLRVIRALKNWTSSDLAKEIGISPVTLSRYENKKSSPKTILIMQKIEEIENKVIQEVNEGKKK